MGILNIGIILLVLLVGGLAFFYFKKKNREEGRSFSGEVLHFSDTETRECHHCKAQNPKDTRFCGKCGRSLHQG